MLPPQLLSLALTVPSRVLSQAWHSRFAVPEAGPPLLPVCAGLLSS